jgi:hypothetical protein
MTYLLAGAPPLEVLTDRFPEITFDWRPKKGQLQITYLDGTLGPGDLNRMVLPLLLDAGVPVLEVRRGSDLESEYLLTRTSHAPDEAV